MISGVGKICSVSLQRFRGRKYGKITFRSPFLKMETVGSSETYAHIYQATGCHITEGSDIYTHRRQTYFTK
jgi:hypothetical protein